MMCYKDICYCAASAANYDGQKCTNTDCNRHAKHIPYDLPEWELIALADFSDRCVYYKKLGQKIMEQTGR